MSQKDHYKLTDSKRDDYTKISFEPDLNKFGMVELEQDICSLMMRRAYDVAGSLHGVKVMLNGNRLPVCYYYLLLTIIICCCC